MSRRKRHTVKSMGREEAAVVNSMFDELYRSRVMSRYWRDPDQSATIVVPYTSFETGRTTFSATGSATIVKSFAIREVMSDILHAEAHANHVGVLAIVTDVTASGITIEARTISATGAFSSVTTASVGVSWLVIGSTP